MCAVGLSTSRNEASSGDRRAGAMAPPLPGAGGSSASIPPQSAKARVKPLVVPGLLEPERLDPVVVRVRVAGVDAVGEGLDEAEQRGVRAHVGRAVGGVIELDLREFRDLRERRVDDRDGARLAVAGELHGPRDQRVWATGGKRDDKRVL